MPLTTTLSCLPVRLPLQQLRVGLHKAGIDLSTEFSESETQDSLERYHLKTADPDIIWI